VALPRDVIVDRIAAALKPWRRGVHDRHGEIVKHIGLACELVEKLAPVLRARQISEAAEREYKANAALVRESGGAFGHTGAHHNMIDILRNLPHEQHPDERKRKINPNQRFGLVQWVCAHQACVLVEQLSQRDPAASGNVLTVARLIYEAVKGEPPSPSALLRSCRDVLGWRTSEQDIP
jgi:hypothetical protein